MPTRPTQRFAAALLATAALAASYDARAEEASVGKKDETAGVAAAEASAALDPVTERALAGLRSLTIGEMRGLDVHDAPIELDLPAFTDERGDPVPLETFRGRAVLVNYWATWCAPCVKEMPSIDRLAAELESDEFAVVALNVERRSPERLRVFLDDIGAGGLAIYQDAAMDWPRGTGAIGMPTTLLLDRSGREVARLTGPAEWDAAEVKALLQAFVENTRPTGE